MTFCDHSSDSEPTRGSKRSLSHSFWLAVAALAATSMGCPGGDPGVEPDAATDGPPVFNGTVELGQGTVDFEPLLPEDELILWSGPQGGHHFIVHARIKDIAPGDWERPGMQGNPITEFTAFDESGRQVDLMVPPYALGYRDLGDDWMYFPSGRFLRTIEDYVPDIFFQRIRIVVNVRDANGVLARDERWIVAIQEPETEGDGGS